MNDRHIGLQLDGDRVVAVTPAPAATPPPSMWEALEQWKCPACGGGGKYQQDARGRAKVEARGDIPDPKFQPDPVTCKVCKGDGLHPIASAALSATAVTTEGEPDAARADIFRSALLDIKAAHVPDQPSDSQGDETSWVMRHVAAIRGIAMKALDEAAALPTAKAAIAGPIDFDPEMLRRDAALDASGDVRATVIEALKKLGHTPWRLEPHDNNPYNCHVVDAAGANVIVNVGRAFGEWCVLAAALSQSPATDAAAKREAQRWPRKGDLMVFRGKNGHDFEIKEALAIFTVGLPYRVHHCDVEAWRHSVQFDGVKGCFNGVMFELVTGDVA